MDLAKQKNPIDIYNGDISLESKFTEEEILIGKIKNALCNRRTFKKPSPPWRKPPSKSKDKKKNIFRNQEAPLFTSKASRGQEVQSFDSDKENLGGGNGRPVLSPSNNR